MDLEFIPGLVEPENLQGERDKPVAANWFMFIKGKFVIIDGDVKNPIPYFPSLEQVGIQPVSRHYLGLFRGEPCYACELDALAELPFGFTVIDLRMMLGRLPESWFMLAGRARQILDWDINHKFCGRCGTQTHFHVKDRAKECPQCHLIQYPRLAPSIIVLITKGKEVLLARSANFPPGMFSTLAGFVEPGETIEQAVHREVYEEVGIHLQNLQYRNSQPWPFPNSLMLGFHAEYLSGDINVDNDEIVEANWWPVDQLPMIPPRGSISRQLIDQYIEFCTES
ncbi:MAG TPA: NAD(+) diphosphatase [Pseudomonadales bacterium]